MENEITKALSSFLTEFKRQTGHITVLSSAVHALVASHPEPEKFAQAFRSAWIKAGQLHSQSELDQSALHGMGEMLGLLENACAVPLKVRAKVPK